MNRLQWEEIVQRAMDAGYSKGELSERIWREIERAGYKLVRS